MLYFRHMGGQETQRDEMTVDSMPQSNWVPTLTILSGGQQGLCLEIGRESFTIGRSRGNTLVLADKAISRRHAAVEEKDGRYFLYDLKSRWGLKVNGIETRECELKFGDEIEIAGIRLGFAMQLREKITVKKKKNAVRIFIYILLLAALVGSALLFYFKHQTRENMNRPGGDILSKIMHHYDQGIQFYNQIGIDPSNKEKAIKEMKIVIELDPDSKTQFSLSARRIIDGLEK